MSRRAAPLLPRRRAGCAGRARPRRRRPGSPVGLARAGQPGPGMSGEDRPRRRGRPGRAGRRSSDSRSTSVQVMPSCSGTTESISSTPAFFRRRRTHQTWVGSTKLATAGSVVAIRTVQPAATSDSAAVGAMNPPSSSAMSAVAPGVGGRGGGSTIWSASRTGLGEPAAQLGAPHRGSRRCDDQVGVERQHVVDRCLDAEPEVDSGAPQLLSQPFEVEVPAIAAVALGGDPRPAADVLRALEQRDLSSAFGRAVGGLGAGHAATDHDHAAKALRSDARCVDLRVADSRIDRAPHGSAFVQPADAGLVETDAGSWGGAGCVLAGKIGIGDDRAGHGDEIDAVHGERVLGGRRIENPAGDQDRNTGDLPHPAAVGAVHVDRQLVAWYECRGRPGRVSGAVGDAEQIDGSPGRDGPRRRPRGRRCSCRPMADLGRPSCEIPRGTIRRWRCVPPGGPHGRNEPGSPANRHSGRSGCSRSGRRTAR